MRKLTKATLTVVGLLALLAGVGWGGLQVKPKPFPPHPERTSNQGTVELHADLPEPVGEYVRATMGERVPRIETAVVWGRGEFNLMGLWFGIPPLARTRSPYATLASTILSSSKSAGLL
ncbi:MAG: hypothetical protein WKF95_09945 [Rubrobacter sp.]